jgi:hypothetical protein
MIVEHVQLESGQHYLRTQNEQDSTTSEIVNYADIAWLEIEGMIILGFTEYYGEYSKVIMGIELVPSHGKGKTTQYEGIFRHSVADKAE